MLTIRAVSGTFQAPWCLHVDASIQPGAFPWQTMGTSSRKTAGPPDKE